MRGRLNRHKVTYRLGDGGVLLPAAALIQRESASGEGSLYRRLAALATADDAAICLAASRYGPLGPIGEIGPLGDQRRVLWGLNDGLSAAVTVFEDDRLNLWIASGGGAAVGIPGRLSWAAHLIAALGQLDPSVVRGLLQAARPGGSLDATERASIHRRLWNDVLGAMAWYEERSETIRAQLALGEAPVYITAPPGVTAERLRQARQLLREAMRTMAGHGGAATTIEPGGLGPFLTLLNLYHGTEDTLLYMPETVDAWRAAGSEFALWVEVVRLLRRARRNGRDAGPALDAVLSQLRSTASVSLTDATNSTRSIVQLTSEASSLLALRLQQIDAWPYPADYVALGTFARGLWSLWAPVTDSAVPRRCAWHAGCSMLLPDDAHGNRRYCREHQRMAHQERTARNRRRRNEDAPATVAIPR